jgi:GNAT superfamily N-acetyltransferase
LFRIRGMTVADIPFGMRLKEQAGWNQVAADWSRLLDLEPEGCFVAELDGTAAGTVTTCRFGRVAWVAMMLVDESFRSRGIGRSLMKHALDHLDSHGVVTVRLDASPLGRPLYESLDFVAEATLARYVGVLPPANGLPEVPAPASSKLLDGVTQLDHQVSGTDRERLIRRLIQEQPDSFHVAIESNVVCGFLLARPGARATRIGPCIASKPAAELLLADARRRYAAETITMDIPVDNATAIALASSWGLDMTGSLTRMSRGPSVHEDLSRLWASTGPEKG